MYRPIIVLLCVIYSGQRLSLNQYVINSETSYKSNAAMMMMMMSSSVVLLCTTVRPLFGVQGVSIHSSVPTTVVCVTGDNNMCASCLRSTADFGFARYLQSNMMAATLCGSPMYMVSVFYSLYFLCVSFKKDLSAWFVTYNSVLWFLARDLFSLRPQKSSCPRTMTPRLTCGA